MKKIARIFLSLICFFIIFPVYAFANQVPCLKPGSTGCDNVTNICCTPVINTGSDSQDNYKCVHHAGGYQTAPYNACELDTVNCKGKGFSPCTGAGSLFACCGNDPNTKEALFCNPTTQTCEVQKPGSSCADVGKSCGAKSPKGLSCCNDINSSNQTLLCLDGQGNLANDTSGTCTYENMSVNANPPQATPPPPPCAQFIDSNGDNIPNANTKNVSGCGSVNTALGPWSADPSGFVTSLFGILLSISGGIAVLLIMFSGYRIVTSQGDPEKLQGGKEQLTAAIVGLLFIIFSLVILQIIGVDVLKLPGFSGS